MADRSARSPKRVHILASINPLAASLPADKEHSPPPRHRSHRKRSLSPNTKRRIPQADEEIEEHISRVYESGLLPPRATKFRFKSKSSHQDRPRSDRSRDDDHQRRSRSRSHSPSSTTHNSHRHHRRHRHHHRRRRSASPAPADPHADPHAPPPLDPDIAFREALFDAMADDEGAAYWEGVYGQPLHIYERDSPGGDGGESKGSLERMTDEEYAEHVRQRMWEKTHSGLLEARERRKAERAAKAERESQQKKKSEENERIQREVERSLRTGNERREKRDWNDKWDAYLEKWEGWDGTVSNVAWPVEKAVRKDVGGSDAAGKAAREAVRIFFTKGLQLEKNSHEDSAVRLKEERVRWHPDKMQQRLGGMVEADVMRDITAIFQVVDQLWNDIRSKLPRGKA